MLSNSAEPAFVHLRMHSEFSIADSTIRIDGAISRAVDDQMPALALTDLANLFGAVKFYQNTRRNGIKPIIGSDVWISDETEARLDVDRVAARHDVGVPELAAAIRYPLEPSAVPKLEVIAEDPHPRLEER